MALGLLGRDRGGRQVEPPPNRLGDVADGDPFLADRVEHGPGRCALDPEPDQPGGVGAVDRGPAVDAFADVGGGAGRAVSRDDPGDEAVVAGTMDRGGKADADRADPAFGERQGRALVAGPAARTGQRYFGDGFAGFANPSLLDGFEEFREFLPSRASSSATRPASSVINASRSTSATSRSPSSISSCSIEGAAKIGDGNDGSTTNTCLRGKSQHGQAKPPATPAKISEPRRERPEQLRRSS